MSDHTGSPVTDTVTGLERRWKKDRSNGGRKERERSRDVTDN